jgi:hypothetical protein
MIIGAWRIMAGAGGVGGAARGHNYNVWGVGFFSGPRGRVVNGSGGCGAWGFLGREDLKRDVVIFVGMA